MTQHIQYDAGAQQAPAEQLAAAASTLAHLGYTYRGGAEWAPPIGRTPDFNLLDTANTRIAELEAESSQLQGSLDAQRMITDRAIALGKESDTKLSATQAEAKHWRSNHDNVVARLRIFTQRPDIPKELADRLPWYRELVRLQEVAAQAAAKCVHPVEALLFEHKDGRHAVNPDTAGDPDWHRVGPVMVYGPAALQAAPPAPAAMAVPAGFALVPMRLTRAMERVLSADEEGWQWEDLLAAAEAITEEEYAALAAAPAQPAVWMTPEADRVVTEATTASARKDGGAMLSSLRPFTVPLARAAAPAQEHATQLAGQETPTNGAPK